MYRVLYPECVTSGTHGLSLEWEVQLIHGEFIDQELKGSKDFFQFKNFLDA